MCVPKINHNICYIIVSLSREYIRQIGRNPNKKAKLTKYQEAINHAVMELCLNNPNLIDDRKALLQAKIGESGYVYKKGKSRSKLLTSGDQDSSVSKRTKITVFLGSQSYRATRSNQGRSCKECSQLQRV